MQPVLTVNIGIGTQIDVKAIEETAPIKKTVTDSELRLVANMGMNPIILYLQRK